MSDKVLQVAVKQERVLTIYQQVRGSKKDFGVVGLETAPHAQYLVFPKSLRKFAGSRIVGVRYDLVKEEMSSGVRLPPARSRPKPATQSKSKKIVQFEEVESGTPPRQENKEASVVDPATKKLPEEEDANPVKRELRKAIADLRARHVQKARKRLEALLRD